MFTVIELSKTARVVVDQASRAATMHAEEEVRLYNSCKIPTPGIYCSATK